MSAIDEYLAELDDELHVRLWRRERILAEARAHLRQSTWATQARDGVTPAEAQRRAIAAFGAPEQVAAGFAAEAGGRLNGAAVAVSDLSYRIARKPVALAAIAWWPVNLVALAALGITSGFLYMSVCSFGGWLLFTALAEVKPAPREGYLRRWRKLESAARRQIIAALSRENASLQATAGANVAIEVGQRVRRLRRYSLVLGLFFLVLLYTGIVVYAAAAGRLAPVGTESGLAAAALLACTMVNWWDLRSARRQATAELAAFDVVDEVAREALEHGSAHIQERIDGLRFCFELAPENPDACPVALEVRRSEIWLWLGPYDLLLRLKRRDADHLDKLALYLDAVVSGRYHEKAVAVRLRRGLAPRPRLYTQLTGTFATTNGSQVVTGHRFHAKDWEERWQADAARLDVDPADHEIEYAFAAYETGDALS